MSEKTFPGATEAQQVGRKQTQDPGSETEPGAPSAQGAALLNAHGPRSDEADAQNQTSYQRRPEKRICGGHAGYSGDASGSASGNWTEER